jgi:hypothetical protein
MSLDSVTDALFAALIAVPVTLVAVGLVELAILTLVALPIVACLTAALLPDAPFRSPAEHGAQPPVDPYPADRPGERANSGAERRSL